MTSVGGNGQAWTGLEPAYLTWVSNVNAAHTAYQTNVNAAATLQADRLASADEAQATTTANAVATREKSLANAMQAYVHSLSGPTKTYLVAVGAADHELRIKQAEAERDFVVTGDGEARSVANGAATAKHEADLKAAKNTFGIGEARALGGRRISAAVAQLLYTVATHTADAVGEAARSVVAL